jgi:hypothetical protein
MGQGSARRGGVCTSIVVLTGIAWGSELCDFHLHVPDPNQPVHGLVILISFNDVNDTLPDPNAVWDFFNQPAPFTFAPNTGEANGRDAGIPGSGVAVWHARTRASLPAWIVEADGDDFLLLGNDYGQATDLWVAPERSIWGPQTCPNSAWAGDIPSGLVTTCTSAPGTTTTFTYRVASHNFCCHADMNCDDEITFADVDWFIEAISGESFWAHDPCPWLNADCSGDGIVTFADVDPFIALLNTICANLTCCPLSLDSTSSGQDASYWLDVLLDLRDWWHSP